MKVASVYYNDPFFSRGGHEHVFIGYPDDLYKLKGCDLAVLWGGEDISTTIYGEKAVWTDSRTPSYRDRFELSIMDAAKGLGIPILGICRGGQLMVAANGGKLWQHVDRHAGPNHDVEFVDGDVIEVNSYHHQMFRPAKDHVVLGVSKPRATIQCNQDGKFAAEEPEAEFVYIPKVGLAVQPHPEYLSRQAPLVQKTLQLIKTHLGVQL